MKKKKIESQKVELCELCSKLLLSEKRKCKAVEKYELEAAHADMW